MALDSRNWDMEINPSVSAHLPGGCAWPNDRACVVRVSPVCGGYLRLESSSEVYLCTAEVASRASSWAHGPGLSRFLEAGNDSR